MSLEAVTNRLSPQRSAIVRSVYKHGCLLLDHSPRFKFFTLHGSHHLGELFRIFEIVLAGGAKLNERQIYLLSLAICTHDLGMVAGLSELGLKEISEGRGGVPDPANFEDFIRNIHHEIISEYFSSNSNFLVSLGVSISEAAIVIEIGKCHRKVDLRQRHGDVRNLGALLRVVDELDVGPSRAPAALLVNNHDAMDPISKWHWFKHVITEEWAVDHNVEYRKSGNIDSIIFSAAVHPTREESIGYWISQIVRPIRKVLTTEEAQAIIYEAFSVKIEIIRGDNASNANRMGGVWPFLEEQVLTQGRKVIMVVDDDADRIEDAFFALMDDYHLKFIPSVKSAFQFLDSVEVSLVVADLQMPTEDLWSDTESEESRMTGFQFIKAAKLKHENIKTCIFTGSRHPITKEAQDSVDLFLRKPIDPMRLKDQIVSLLETKH